MPPRSLSYKEKIWLRNLVIYKKRVSVLISFKNVLEGVQEDTTGSLDKAMDNLTSSMFWAKCPFGGNDFWERIYNSLSIKREDRDDETQQGIDIGMDFLALCVEKIKTNIHFYRDSIDIREIEIAKKEVGH